MFHDALSLASSIPGLLQARTIRGFCHLYDGQEAVAAGVQSALDVAVSLIGVAFQLRSLKAADATVGV